MYECTLRVIICLHCKCLTRLQGCPWVSQRNCAGARLHSDYWHTDMLGILWRHSSCRFWAVRLPRWILSNLVCSHLMRMVSSAYWVEMHRQSHRLRSIQRHQGLGARHPWYLRGPKTELSYWFWRLALRLCAERGGSRSYWYYSEAPKAAGGDEAGVVLLGWVAKHSFLEGR